VEMVGSWLVGVDRPDHPRRPLQTDATGSKQPAERGAWQDSLGTSGGRNNAAILGARPGVEINSPSPGWRQIT